MRVARRQPRGGCVLGEAAALGVPHPTLGQAIVVIAKARDGARLETDALLAECRQRLPAFMVPARVITQEGALPRNANGKIDRKSLALQLQDPFGNQDPS